MTHSGGKLSGIGLPPPEPPNHSPQHPHPDLPVDVHANPLANHPLPPPTRFHATALPPTRFRPSIAKLATSLWLSKWNLKIAPQRSKAPNHIHHYSHPHQ